jgi:hypothetical protein
MSNCGPDAEGRYCHADRQEAENALADSLQRALARRGTFPEYLLLLHGAA